MPLYSVRFPRVNLARLDPARTSDPDPEPLDRHFPCPECAGTDTFTFRDPDPTRPPEAVCIDCLKESFVRVPHGAA